MSKRLFVIAIAIGLPIELWAAEYQAAAWACYAPGNAPSSTEAFGENADRLINLYEYQACDGEDVTPNPSACRVTYVKNGRIETLWSAKTDKDYCGEHAKALATRLEQAGFVCTNNVDVTGPCTDKLSGVSSARTQEILPGSSGTDQKDTSVGSSLERRVDREVDAYFKLVRKLAAAGDVRFDRELKWLATVKGGDSVTPTGGALSESSYYENWEVLKKTAVMKGDIQVWVVQSSYCLLNTCASIVVQPLPSADDFSELQLIDVFAGQPDLEFVDCIEANGAHSCWRDESNRPILHVQDAQGRSGLYSLYVYDSATDKYTTFLTCQQRESGRAPGHTYKLFSPLHPGEVLDSGRSDYEQLCEGVLLNALLYNAADGFEPSARLAQSTGSHNQVDKTKWREKSSGLGSGG